MHVRAKKHLGQHFLRDLDAARRIAALADTALREAFLQGQERLMGLGPVRRSMIAQNPWVLVGGMQLSTTTFSPSTTPALTTAKAATRQPSPREAARGPQMRPQEVPKEVLRGLWASSRPDRVRGRDGEERVRSPQNGHERPRVCFPKVLKIRGCHEDGRQLESLHFYRVP